MGWGSVGLYNMVQAAYDAQYPLSMSAECSEMLSAAKASLQFRDSEMPPSACRLLGVETTPWPHQVKAVSLATNLSSYLLALDMGTGKTLCALALLAQWTDAMTSGRVLIVCPKSVIDVWPMEFDKHMTPAVRKRFHITALNQRTVAGKVAAAANAEKLAGIHRMVSVHIINYDAIWRPEFAKWLKDKTMDVVILDEGHRVKSHDGRASRFVGELADRTRKRLVLTGTPMPHSPLDIYGQYRFLDKSAFGTVFGDFKSRYAVLGGFEMREVVAFKNELDMNRRIEAISYRVKKSDVLTLPPVVHVERPVEMCAAAKAIYKNMEKNLYAQVGSGEVTAANALVKILRLLQITSGTVETDDGIQTVVDDSKIKGFCDLVEDLPATEPVVIFSRFTRDIDLVRTALAGMGRTCAVLDGRINQLSEWQAGEYDDIVIQIRSGGAGVDLTRSAYAVYYTPTHSLGDHDQSLARLDRHGQIRSVTYFYLISKGTIDEKVYAALQNKRDVVEYVLEGIKHGGRDGR